MIAGDAAPVERPPFSKGYSWYGMTVLLVVYTLNLLDRQIVTIVAEPIKQDLGLLDWQIGLMGGLAFAVFYTTLGIPIARFAERGNRPYVIGASVIAWSAFTAVCGLAQNFLHLVLARFGVGIGEAGCLPASLSLVSDYVAKERRASAISVVMAGAPVGSLLGMILGGFVAAQWGWRSAFLLLGIPGILIGLLAIATLIEPRLQVAATAQPTQPSFREVARTLWGKRTYRLLVAGSAAKGFVNFGIAAFLGSFYLRNHGPALAELGLAIGMRPLAVLGLVLGLSMGLTGVLGTLVGGLVTDRLGRLDIRFYAMVPGIAILLATPFYMAAFSVDSLYLSLGLILLPAFLSTTWYGPCYSMVQGLVLPRMRATASAILLLVTNLIGLGLGPVLIGYTSDLIAHSGYGAAASIKWSLIIYVLAGSIAGGLFWAARSSLQRDTVS